MDNYVLDFYRQLLVSLNRGNVKGVASNAKPIFVLSLIDFIPYTEKNLFTIDDKILNNIYKKNIDVYSTRHTTPIRLPYFHLQTEPFYQLIWRSRNVSIRASESPSIKRINETIIGAKLDDELWELLQVPENREYLRNCIINQYLSYKKTEDGNNI